MPHLYVGTSGWAYAAWKPLFYPAKLAQSKFLSHYASRLTSVEVNYSFRHFLPEKTLQNWIAATPPEFRFCVKAHQAITHIKRLKNAAEAAQRFVASLQLLEGEKRLGPVLFQLPPNMKADTALLREFLDALPRNFRCAFEFRHPTWLADEIYAVLKDRNAALCVAESEDLVVPDVPTADYCYYRFRKPDYAPDERAELAKRLHQRLSEGMDVYAFYKHEESPDSPLQAEELLKAAP